MISILGCGWFGLPLGKALVGNGFTVKGSTTTPERLNELRSAGLDPYLIGLDPEAPTINDGFFDSDTLVISIPPKARSGQGELYLSKIELLINNIIKHNIKQVILISSTGVYPECNAEVDELTIPQPDTASGKILFAAEEMLYTNPHFTTTVVRFGGLVGPGRHPGRFFSGKVDIPNGQAPVNLIHLRDCIGIMQAIIQQRAFGKVFNACVPQHPTKQQFYKAAALHAGLPEPRFIDELLEWKVINSVNIPNLLNYRFEVDDLIGSFNGNLY